MCLILVAHRVHPVNSLVIAANRDEFHARPTASSHFWQVPDGILAGRDLEAGGTWLGLGRHGQFAAVTNVSEAHEDGQWLSRGDLVQQFLAQEDSAVAFAAGIQGQKYRGFNLLLWDGNSLTYTSNRGGAAETLPPGIYGLANDSLGESRFKVQRGTEALAAATTGSTDDDALVDALFSLLSDTTAPTTPERRRVPGMSAAMQRALGACFIVGEAYGTRASTVVLLHAGGGSLIERVYAPAGIPAGTSHHRVAFTPDPAGSTRG
ncbi:MAG: NRDE family protein [Chromatocurvus sp.]